MYNSGYAIVEMHDGMLDVLWYSFIGSNSWELIAESRKNEQVVCPAKGIFDVMILGTASEIFYYPVWGPVKIIWILKWTQPGIYNIGMLSGKSWVKIFGLYLRIFPVLYLWS